MNFNTIIKTIKMVETRIENEQEKRLNSFNSITHNFETELKAMAFDKVISNIEGKKMLIGNNEHSAWSISSDWKRRITLNRNIDGKDVSIIVYKGEFALYISGMDHLNYKTQYDSKLTVDNLKKYLLDIRANCNKELVDETNRFLLLSKCPSGQRVGIMKKMEEHLFYYELLGKLYYEVNFVM